MVDSALLFSESTQILGELVTAAKTVSDRLSLVAVFPRFDQEQLSGVPSADKLVAVDVASPQAMDYALVSKVLIELQRKHGCTLVLTGATRLGKEVAATLGAMLDAPVSSDCRRIEMSENGAVVTRTVLSGNGVATEEMAGKVVVASVQPGSYAASPPADNPVFETIQPDTSGKALTALELRPKKGGLVKLEDAQRIVAVGRGLRSKEDLAMIGELASALNAAVGCSRPVAADLGWLGDDQWIGLSGHKVRPKLYVAIGISGQVQHLAGMRDSGVVVSINKDANAPMSSNADYVVVGDLYQIVPELIRQLKSAH